MYKPFSLTFIIACDGRYYLGDDNPKKWGALEAACLYTEVRAEEKLRELSEGNGKCVVYCLIQDEHFNFYDGHTFVYALSAAKLYTSDQGHRIAQKLHGTLHRP